LLYAVTVNHTDPWWREHADHPHLVTTGWTTSHRRTMWCHDPGSSWLNMHKLLSITLQGVTCVLVWFVYIVCIQFIYCTIVYIFVYIVCMQFVNLYVSCYFSNWLANLKISLVIGGHMINKQSDLGVFVSVKYFTDHSSVCFLNMFNWVIPWMLCWIIVNNDIVLENMHRSSLWFDHIKAKWFFHNLEKTEILAHLESGYI
jgi:hypothetical protein